MSIPLRSRRGAIGTSWHAVALRDAAERLLGSARAGRGKSDARAGRVQWLDVDTGAARGDVLDADGELYQARLELPALHSGDREVFVQVARTHPELPARLAAGEYPQQIEAELAVSEISLLPRSAIELSHDCSCLDWPGPCRHVSALLYVLVEAVDVQPVLLLTLRGLALEDLVAPVAARGRRAPEYSAESADAADGSGAGTGSSAADGNSAVDGSSAGDSAGPGPRHRTDEGEDADAGTRAGTSDGGSTAEDPDADPAPRPAVGPAARAAFDPARTDPSQLAEVVGEEVAAVIHSFYTRSS